MQCIYGPILHCIAYCIHGDCRYACFILRPLSITMMIFIVRKRSMLSQWPIGQYKQDQFVLYKSTFIIVIVIMRYTTPGNGLCNLHGTQANIIVWLGLETKHPKNNETQFNTYEKRYARQWIFMWPKYDFNRCRAITCNLNQYYFQYGPL